MPGTAWGDQSAPASGGQAVVLDTAFAATSRAIWVGTAGNVRAVLADGPTLTFVGVQAGSLLPVAATMVTTSGTTAGSMLALF